MITNDQQQELIRHLVNGTKMDLLGVRQITKRASTEEMAKWPLVSAKLVRDLLIGRGLTGLLPDPKGLRLRGARFDECLDISYIESTIPLILEDCLLSRGMNADYARLPLLTLKRCNVDRIPADSSIGADSALHADTLHVTGDMDLTRSKFIGSAKDGAVWLLGARLPEGQLIMSGAYVTNDLGPALSAQGIHTGDNVFLDDGFYAEGSGILGTVNLNDATVDGQVLCRQATFKHTGAGPALAANGLDCDILFLGEKLLVKGGDEFSPAIDLGRAKLGGLSCSDASIKRAEEKPLEPYSVLDLHAAEVKFLRIPGDIVCRQNAKASWRKRPSDCQNRFVSLDGLKYDSLDARFATWQCWLHWLRFHMTRDRRSELNHDDQPSSNGPPTKAALEFAEQPYMQLSIYERSNGNDSAANQVLITQEEHRRKSGAVGGPLAVFWHKWILGAVIGYGYRTKGALIGLTAVLVASIGVSLLAGEVLTTESNPDRYILTHSSDSEARGAPLPTQAPSTDQQIQVQGATAVVQGSRGTPCSLVEQIGVGIDRGLPLINTGVRDHCTYDTTSRYGQLVTVASWVLQLMAWALATLFIAGYTGLVRRN